MLCDAMLCYVMLCYAMLCYAMQCYVMLCDAMLCYAMLCYAMLCYAMLCYAMLCYAMLCYAVLCCAVLCYAMLSMLCYAMLCCAVLCCAALRLRAVGTFCPCWLFGHNAESMGDGFYTNCCLYLLFHLCCLCSVVHKPRRTKMREQHNLQEILGGDCCNVVCCPYCSLCQEAQELHLRGILSFTPDPEKMIDTHYTDPMYEVMDISDEEGRICNTCHGEGTLHGIDETAPTDGTDGSALVTDSPSGSRLAAEQIWCPDCQGVV
eukprot:g61573.t1